MEIEQVIVNFYFWLTRLPEQRLRQKKHTTKPEEGKQRQNF